MFRKNDARCSEKKMLDVQKKRLTWGLTEYKILVHCVSMCAFVVQKMLSCNKRTEKAGGAGWGSVRDHKLKSFSVSNKILLRQNPSR